MSPEDKLVKELAGMMALEGAKVAIKTYECVLMGLSPNRILQVLKQGRTSEIVTEVADKIVELVVQSAKETKALDDKPSRE